MKILYITPITLQSIGVGRFLPAQDVTLKDAFRERLRARCTVGALVCKALVIEGFPRSANTFAVVAFRQAQERYVPIAHHLRG